MLIFLCHSIALYCLCVVSCGLYKYHLVPVSWGKNWLRRLSCDRQGGSDNFRQAFAPLTCLC